jgi:putative salt-induced outer membrane protein YdiY
MSPQVLIGDESEQEESPWSTSIGFGYTTTRGNSETDNVALTYQTIYAKARSKWSSLANLTYTTTDGERAANKGGFKTQYDFIPSERIFYFAQVGIEYDEFAELDLRTSPGGGVGYILMKEEEASLSVSAGANLVTDFFSDDTKDTRGMLAISQDYERKITSTSSVYQNFNIQNNFEDFGDYLIGAEISLTTMVSEKLSLKASFIDKYDSTPFSEDLKKNDITFLTSLNYSF